MIQGLDVSKWQGDMNWGQAWGAGARFAIIKCSEGASYRAPMFTEFYDGAVTAGLMVGAYHFFRATISGDAQVVNVKNAIGERELDLPVAIDVELFDNVEPMLATSRLQQMVYGLQGYKGHAYPMIYTAAGLWNPHILAWSGWKDCPLWVANWNVAVPKLPRDWTEYTIWQTGKEAGAKWGATSREIDVNQYPYPITPPDPEPDQVMGYMQVLIDGKLYTGNVVLEEDT